MSEDTWSQVDAARQTQATGASLHAAQQLRLDLALVLADATADGRDTAPVVAEYVKARAAHVYAAVVHDAARAELRAARLRIAQSA